jgi:hypothetical protein
MKTQQAALSAPRAKVRDAPRRDSKQRRARSETRRVQAAASRAALLIKLTSRLQRRRRATPSPTREARVADTHTRKRAKHCGDVGRGGGAGGVRHASDTHHACSSQPSRSPSRLTRAPAAALRTPCAPDTGYGRRVRVSWVLLIMNRLSGALLLLGLSGAAAGLWKDLLVRGAALVLVALRLARPAPRTAPRPDARLLAVDAVTCFAGARLRWRLARRAWVARGG